MKQYIVAYCVRKVVGTVGTTLQPKYKFKDHYKPFIEEINGNSPHRQAMIFYNHIKHKTFKNGNKEVYSVNLAQIMYSTDYS